MNTPQQTLQHPDILYRETQWFAANLKARLHAIRESEPFPALSRPHRYDAGTSLYPKTIAQYDFSAEERFILLLALIPHLQPELLDDLKPERFPGSESAIGGFVGQKHKGFLPSIETALYLTSGGHMAMRLSLMQCFSRKHPFQAHCMLDLGQPSDTEPLNARPLKLSSEFLDYLLHSMPNEPITGRHFPAKHLITKLDWEDLVITPETQAQMTELLAWMDHEHTLLHDWELEKRLKRGYRCLLYGPPGTGKTLTATLLGKRFDRPVYRIDLSQLVSKYIGETEKNLEEVFSQAERKNWILFFDEADSLFSKRTSIESSNDRHANQETGFLLQRIEDCPNVVLLASNLKDNIDNAFLRRFQSLINFPMPRKKERFQLWQQGFSKVSRFDRNISLEQIAEEYELAGGAINNIVRYASLMAIQEGRKTIAQPDLLAGIKREFSKEGKYV
ncbi:hypothetical protein BVY04_04715 [bacterium M21]|nr:hypothetical protein BVY04_04715 [bacterium M21]